MEILGCSKNTREKTFCFSNIDIVSLLACRWNAGFVVRSFTGKSVAEVGISLITTNEALEEIGSNEFSNSTKFPKIRFSTHRAIHQQYLPYHQHVLR
jgi:hypothetical protein